MSTPARRFFAAVAGAATLVAAGVLATSDPAKAPFIVATGVLGSLIASFIAIGVNLIVVGDSTGEVERAASALSAGVERLDAATDVLAHAHRHGILAVKPKEEFSKEEWKAILTDAHERLFFVGHALDKWCKEGVQDTFSAALRRLAAAGKDVWLITLPLDGETREDPRRGLNYGDRIRTTMRLLAEVHSGLPADCQDHLKVRTLKPGLTMPYMVVGNERTLITSAYPNTEQKERHNARADHRQRGTGGRDDPQRRWRSLPPLQ